MSRYIEKSRMRVREHLGNLVANHASSLPAEQKETLICIADLLLLFESQLDRIATALERGNVTR